MAKTASGVVLLVPASGCSICMSAQCSATETNSSSRQMGSVRSRFKTCANAVYTEWPSSSCPKETLFGLLQIWPWNFTFYPPPPDISVMAWLGVKHKITTYPPPPPFPPMKTNTCHIFHSALSSSSTAGSCLLSVVVNCVCVYVLKIIPQDTILCCINAFIIDREERQGGLPSSRSQPLSWRRLWQQPQPRQQPTRPPQPVPPPWVEYPV